MITRRTNGRRQDRTHEVTVTSVLASDCTIHGDIRCREGIRIDGTVEGEVEAENAIIIGPSGKVNASLHAKQIIIGGEVHGDVTAEERLEIQSTGSLIGDVCAPKLSISEGVIFQGRCLMNVPEQGKSTPEDTPPERISTYPEQV